MRFLIPLLCLFSIMFFTSCSSKNQTQGSLNCLLESSSCSTVLGGNKQALKIRILGPATLVIPVTQTELKFVGLCNEGAYPDNYIQWRIVKGSAGVDDDDKLSSEGIKDNSQCINGKFKLNINISSKLRENKGSETDITRTSYKIKLSIIGFDYNANTAVSAESIYALEFEKKQ